MAWTEEGTYADSVLTEEGDTTTTYTGVRLDATGRHIFPASTFPAEYVGIIPG